MGEFPHKGLMVKLLKQGFLIQETSSRVPHTGGQCWSSSHKGPVLVFLPQGTSARVPPTGDPW
jgi:hypothetical protein